jgi:thiamine biosynthesis protein ThiI
MEALFLVKYGELALKGKNRPYFEKKLVGDIQRKTAGVSVKIIRDRGRLYIYCGQTDTSRIAEILSSTFGLVAFARTFKAEKDMPSIENAALALATKLLEDGNRFKIKVRRLDKRFFLNSYQIACRLGDHLRFRLPELKVDLHNSDWILNVEIRDSVYLYGPEIPAPGGLPLGCSGKGLLLLSGGIDSPVAGYLMGKRGLKMDAVYFHTPPFTSQRVQDKVERLTDILSAYLSGITLYVVPFTDAQLRIKERAHREKATLLMRACMIKIAEKIACQSQCNCMVTGDSLGQVASQTPESLRFTAKIASLPIFQPLIGLDKQEIVNLARKIGTYETSILPYADCCSLFVPSRPLIRPEFHSMMNAYQSLEVEELLERAVAELKSVFF